MLVLYAYRQILVALFFLAMPISVLGVDLTTAELYGSSELISNTLSCGGDIPCEAVFTVISLDDKMFDSNDLAITFENKHTTRINPSFTVEYSIGSLQNVSHTLLERDSCSTTIEANGSTSNSCTYRNVTIVSEEIVYDGKALKAGTNYIRIWSNNKPADQWVDWHVLIQGIPANKGSTKTVDFDTHQKGWAVWGIAPQTGSTNASEYFFYDDMENSSAYGTNYVTTTFMAYSPSQAYQGTMSLRLNSTTGVSHETYIANGTAAFNITEFSSPYCVDFYYRYDGQPSAPNKEQGIWLGTSWVSAGWFMSSDVVHNDYLTFLNASDWYPSKNDSPINSWNYTKFCVNQGYATSGSANVTFYDSTGLLNTTSWPRSQLYSINFIQRETGHVIWFDNIRIWNYTRYGIMPPPATIANFTPANQRQVYVYWNSTLQVAPSSVTNKSIMVIVDNATFGNGANADFGDVRVKMVNSTGNDTQWDYKLTWINSTHANITFTVSSNGSGTFNAAQKYFFVWGNNTGGTTTSNSSLWTNFTSAPTNWTFGIITNYNEGEVGNAANESQGREAILSGIQASTIGSAYTLYYDRQVYIRIANGSQYKGTFDVFVASEEKRWAFNYDQTTVAGFPTFANITPVFWTWQRANLSTSVIAGNVTALIDATN